MEKLLCSWPEKGQLIKKIFKLSGKFEKNDLEDKWSHLIFLRPGGAFLYTRDMVQDAIKGIELEYMPREISPIISARYSYANATVYGQEEKLMELLEE